MSTLCECESKNMERYVQKYTQLTEQIAFDESKQRAAHLKFFLLSFKHPIRSLCINGVNSYIHRQIYTYTHGHILTPSSLSPLLLLPLYTKPRCKRLLDEEDDEDDDDRDDDESDDRRPFLREGDVDGVADGVDDADDDRDDDLRI